MDKLRKFIDDRLGGNSTDARWGFFSFSFSLAWVLLAFALASYEISTGSTLMTVWIIAAWFLGIAGIVLLSFSVAVAVWWWKHPLYDQTPTELAGLRKDVQIMAKAIDNLAKEIREHYLKREDEGER